ncbi:MAG TPA: DNA polymerase IV [Bacilli bacterium]
MSRKSDWYPAKGRVILHIDMNAFYCSVHEAVEPAKYRGKPIAVAGSVELRRGIIVTSSYAARKFGVRTGMQVREALKVCPRLILIEPDFALYRTFSHGFRAIVHEYSPLVEVVSIDECYADITGSSQFGTPLEIAEQIQRRIGEEWSLPCSIGIAPNKLLAKMASDLKKPNGITVLRLRDVPKVLWSKPCAELFGIGEKTAAKLRQLHIHTIGQLATAEQSLLIKTFGVHGIWLKKAANGRDDDPVRADRTISKSIGHTTTLPRNMDNLADIRRVLLNLADQVTRRLRQQELVAGTVQIVIRDPHMKTVTRAETLPAPTEHADDVYKTAVRLFERTWRPDNPVRLLGITLQNLRLRKDAPLQLDLFAYENQPKKEKLTRTLDAIRDKFGEDAILTAGMLEDDPRKPDKG